MKAFFNLFRNSVTFISHYGFSYAILYFYRVLLMQNYLKFICTAYSTFCIIYSIFIPINVLKTLPLNIAVILSSQAYIFLFSNWKRTIATIINAAGSWPTIPHFDRATSWLKSTRNYHYTVSNRRSFHQWSSSPPVSLLPLVSFLMFSDCGGTGRCPFCRQSSGFN